MDSEGRSGGLLSLWKVDIELQLVTFSKHHFHAIVEHDNNIKWKLTGIYGQPETHKWLETWALLKSFSSDDDGSPRLVFGDFNEITHQAEKKWRSSNAWKGKCFYSGKH